MDIEIVSDILESPISGYTSYILFNMPITYGYRRTESSYFAPARSEWMRRMDDVRSWLKNHLVYETEVVYMGAFRSDIGKEDTKIKARVSFASNDDAFMFFLYFK